MSENSNTPESTPATEAPEAKPQETFSRDYVQSLRDEAASARVKAKSAVEAAKSEVVKEYEGKLAEKDTAFSELQADHKSVSAELLKLKAVIAAEIPLDQIENAVGLVAGDTEEAISESVERVKALLGSAPAHTPAYDRTQGQGSHIPLNGDPVLDVLKRAVGAK